MTKNLTLIAGVLLSFALGKMSSFENTRQGNKSVEKNLHIDNHLNKSNMKLGAFSISLSVKDLVASKLFYENLGFSAFGGSLDKNYLIMKNGNALIGLFQGMFQNNILTFNPGWDENAQNMKEFDDIREIQKELKRKGVKIDNEVDESTTGPASIFVVDPDGNAILLDQHR